MPLSDLAPARSAALTVQARSQARRLDTLHRKQHTLIYDEGENLAVCACDGWELADAKGLSLAQAKRSHDLHMEMTKQPAVSTGTIVDVDTLPTRFKKLTESLVKKARVHPAWVHLSDTQIRAKVAQGLSTIASQYPWWWGNGRVEKHIATPAQLAALEKARTVKEALNGDYTPTAGALQEA